MIKAKLLLLFALAASPLANAEFNIVDNTGRPAYIDIGYRNILNSCMISGYEDNTRNKDLDLKKEIGSIGVEDIGIVLRPNLTNNSKLKGKDYYALNYSVFYTINEVEYQLPLTMRDIRTIGTSILYNDKNISIFSLEVYANPVSNNKSKEFTSNVYIVNKKNMGVYAPAFLEIRTVLNSSADGSLKFSKLSSVKYNKIKKSYDIVYEMQLAQEDFSASGRVVYEKSPVQHSFTLIPAQDKPFIIKNYIEKRKDSKKIISTDDLYGLEYYFLKKK